MIEPPRRLLRMNAIDFSRVLWFRIFARMKDERIEQRFTVYSASFLMEFKTGSNSQVYLLQS